MYFVLKLKVYEIITFSKSVIPNTLELQCE